MSIEFGHFALILALAVACVQTGVVIYGNLRGDERIKELAQSAAITQFILLAMAFWTLTSAYIASDFSVMNVWANSHSDKPLLYKISGVWGNHEGSMLLWVLLLAGFGASVALFGRNLPPQMRANVIATQGAIGIAFLAFVIFTSNPFERTYIVPMQGKGLNPVLQDPALAIHPPMLYVGYVGLSMAFSFAIAALIEGRLSAAWARWVRPWTLAAWIFLTLGIATGSWWAYYELGWGGWWNWDAVENASFMPWLAATALLHSAIVMEKREALKAWTILLAIIAFAFSLLGTFIVRSGIATSVHSFASDPARGVFVLLILGIFTGGAFALFAWRAPLLSRGGLFAPVSRESSLLLNNLLLMVSCGVVLVGTLFPMVLDLVAGVKMTVGAPYFNWAFGLLMIPLLAVLPLGPFLAWKRGDIAAAGTRTLPAFVLGVLAALSTFLVQSDMALAPIGFGLGVWVIVGALLELGFRARLWQAPGEFMRRLTNLPRASFGTALAHIGVGVAALGIMGTMAWKSEHVLMMKPQQSVHFAEYDVKLERTGTLQGPNYTEGFAEFSVTKNGAPVTSLIAGQRKFSTGGMPTHETGIHLSWKGDLYLSVDNVSEDVNAAVPVHLLFHPLVRLIWLGALLMVAGGILSLADRRLRVGAPVRGKKVKDVAATETAG